MSTQNEKFLQVLRIELDDLQDDIDHLIAQCSAECERRKVSHSVCLENLAQFRNELLGLDSFREILDRTVPASFPTLDKLMEFLKKAFHDEILRCDLVPCVADFVERKMAKVARYVSSCA